MEVGLLLSEAGFPGPVNFLFSRNTSVNPLTAKAFFKRTNFRLRQF